MPQVSLYVDDAMMGRLRQQAAAEGVSLSRHVASRLAQTTRAATPSGLPEGWLDSLYGCLADVDGFDLPPRDIPDRADALPVFD